MCGRSACARPANQIRQSVRASHFHDEERYRPSYNVGPRRFQPVLMRDNDTGERVLRCMRWGLVPFWTKKEPDFGAIVKAINARSDSLTSNKPMFNHIKKTRRCVVIADGFFEWLKDSNPKQPYFVRFSGGKILTMAGLYDVWKNAEGEEIYTYTIITTEPSSAISFLHDRMPLILDNDEEIDKWLNVEIPFDEVKELMKPYEGKLEIFPVSTFVNKIGNDSEECCKEITKKLEAQKITSFFKKSTKNEPKEEIKEEEKLKEDDNIKQEDIKEEEQATKRKHEDEPEPDHQILKKVKFEDESKDDIKKEEKEIRKDLFSEDDIETIVSHGFSREQALEALEKFQGNMEEVFNDLMGKIGE